MTAQKPRQLLVSAKTTAELLDVDVMTVYELAASGALGDKVYIGKGTRNFRLRYSAVEAYVNGLPTEPVPLDETG